MLIHLEKLGKTFGEKVVLHDVTASVEREDRIGIVGQNGAGKTTLLKILTGEYQDYEGEFSVTHGVTLGYLEQNAKLDATLDIYGEMRATFAPVLKWFWSPAFTMTPPARPSVCPRSTATPSHIPSMIRMLLPVRAPSVWRFWSSSPKWSRSWSPSAAAV